MIRYISFYLSTYTWVYFWIIYSPEEDTINLFPQWLGLWKDNDTFFNPFFVGKLSKKKFRDYLYSKNEDNDLTIHSFQQCQYEFCDHNNSDSL